MKHLKSKKVILIVVLAILLVVGIVFGYSFAYFTASVVNDSTINNTVVTTAALEIKFTDGPKVSLENAIPGDEKEKTFKVKNDSDSDIPYDIYMSEVVNTFEDKSDLVYTLESSDGGKNITTETQAPDVPTKIVDSHIIKANEEHNYTLKIKFKETNDNQDDNKEKQFEVTIRINDVQEAEGPDNAVKTIKDLVKNESTASINVIDKGVGSSNCSHKFAYDGTADNNLRYVGSNPCNYVRFNNELWRIMGVMNNVETASGQNQSLLKLRRFDYIGRYSWDTTDSSVNDGRGINQWGESGAYEGADLMRELNTDYLGNITVGTDGKWYSNWYNAKSESKPSSTISSTAQNMIESVKWYLGSPASSLNGSFDTNWFNNSTGVIPSETYIRERSNTNNQACVNGTYCDDNVARVARWTGKVGLFYPSDYLYATSGGTTIDRQTCLNYPITKSESECSNNNWLRNSTSWTISPAVDSGNASTIISCASAIGTNSASSQLYVYPTVYLKSSIKISGGSGSYYDPYTLE